MPFAGWLADIRYGQYKIIQWSLWIMWISALLLAGSLIILQLLESQNGTNLKLVMILLIPLGIGYGGFQANIYNLKSTNFWMLLQMKLRHSLLGVLGLTSAVKLQQVSFFTTFLQFSTR